MNKRFTAIIFDMDGTLVDSEVVWDAVETQMFKDKGLVYDAAVREKVIGLRLDEFFTRLKAHYQLEETVEMLIDELTERMLKQIPTQVQAKRGAQALIEYTAAAGIPYAIASSSSMAIIKATVDAQGWSKLIPHLYTADDVVLGKPAPDVYLYAAEKLGVDPARCLAIEDSPNGARSAVAAGMTCYVVPDSHSHPDKFKGITSHIFTSLEEILADLQNS